MNGGKIPYAFNSKSILIQQFDRQSDNHNAFYRRPEAESQLLFLLRDNLKTLRVAFQIPKTFDLTDLMGVCTG